MLTMPSFKKSLIVEQFQGNYLKSAMESADVAASTSPRETLYNGGCCNTHLGVAEMTNIANSIK